MATTNTFFKTTRKRGAKLARHVLDIIEIERDQTKSRPMPSATTNAWNQRTWARVESDKLNGHVFDVTGLNTEQVKLIAPKGIDCGTAMCFAGHAAVLAGDRLVVPVSFWGRWSLFDKLKGKRRLSGDEICKTVGSDSLEVSLVRLPNGQVRNIEDRAQELLGLEPEEANELFAASNNIRTLRKYVDMMEQGRHLISGEKKPKRQRS